MKHAFTPEYLIYVPCITFTLYISTYTWAYNVLCWEIIFHLIRKLIRYKRPHTQVQMLAKYVSEQIPLLSLLLPIYICTPVVVEVFIVLEV